MKTQYEIFHRQHPNLQIGSIFADRISDTGMAVHFYNGSELVGVLWKSSSIIRTAQEAKAHSAAVIAAIEEKNATNNGACFCCGTELVEGFCPRCEDFQCPTKPNYCWKHCRCGVDHEAQFTDISEPDCLDAHKLATEGE